MKLIDAVRPSNQFRKNCQESQCIVCKDNEKFANCRKANVGYTIFCKNCKSKGITRVYEGESCRNLFQRQREHVDELSKKKESSVLYKHIKSDHKEESPDEVNFQMKIAGTFVTPLRRIINEGVRISKRDENQLMNSKKEFFGPVVKRKL